jgi:hypothetical protein
MCKEDLLRSWRVKKDCKDPPVQPAAIMGRAARKLYNLLAVIHVIDLQIMGRANGKIVRELAGPPFCVQTAFDAMKDSYAPT